MIESQNGKVMTVSGMVNPLELGITDAHSHLWIEEVNGALQGAPVLTERAKILEELAAYRLAGGGAVVDCQPGGCGRDSRALADLSAASEVKVVCCTGYHRRRYDGPDDPLWHAGVDDIRAEFERELRLGTRETRDRAVPVQAGFVKAACEASLAETPPRPARSRAPGCACSSPSASRGCAAPARTCSQALGHDPLEAALASGLEQGGAVAAVVAGVCQVGPSSSSASSSSRRSS